MLFCLAVHWIALQTWFFQDDFVWLGLRSEVHSWRDLAAALFTPRAQGTVRVLSERLFFLIFTWMFGLHSLPFRLWIFLTQFANMVLLTRIAGRLTGSRAAAFAAPILWSANAGMALALGWTAAFYEIACAFAFLLAFYFFLRYIDTNLRRYWIATWMVFLLGFGVLELNVVFPLIASGYALLFARGHFRKTLWLFIPSGLFLLAHWLWIPKATGGAYAMYFGSSMLSMLLQYWAFALATYRVSGFISAPARVLAAVCIAITAAVSVFAARRLARRDWFPLFALGWFVATLLPVLPFRNHFTEYYLAVPAIGIAMLGGYGLSLSRGWPSRLVAALVVCLYLVFSIRHLRAIERYRESGARETRNIILKLEADRDRIGDKTILLDGIPVDVFLAGFNTGNNDDPFRLVDVKYVFLTPGSEAGIQAKLGQDYSSRYFISPAAAFNALKHGALVYRLARNGLVEVTQQYYAMFIAEHGSPLQDFVDVGNPIFAELLAGSWYKIESGHRWMGKSAVVRIGGPPDANRKLYIMGYCDRVMLSPGPFTVTFRADGAPIGSAVLSEPNQLFHLAYPMPQATVGKPSVEISIEVSHTVKLPGASRELGLVFGTFTIK